MPKCSEEQIRNPKTGKCVKIKGEIGKKLLKEYYDGKLILDDEDVKKLPKKTNSLESKYPCKVDQIWNPDTNKCIPTLSDEGFSLAQNKKKMQYEEDNEKLRIAYPFLYNAEEHGVKVPPKIKQKIHQFVEEWKHNRDLYVDEEHKQFCDRKITSLDKSIISTNFAIKIPLVDKTSMLAGRAFLRNFDLDVRKKSVTKMIKGLSFDFNNFTMKHVLYKTLPDSMSYLENYIDMNWLKKMNAYIDNLPTYDIYTLHAYTHYGDVIVNSWMRGKFDKQKFKKSLVNQTSWIDNYFPIALQALALIQKYEGTYTDLLAPGTAASITFDIDAKGMFALPEHLKEKKVPFAQLINRIKTWKFHSWNYLWLFICASVLSFDKVWKPAIIQYINDIQRIFNGAPALEKPLTVYRGVRDDFYLKGSPGYMHTTSGFVSTSLDIDASLNFSGQKCCFKRILLLPGTKVLLLSGVSRYTSEIEILLNANSQFYIRKAKRFLPKDTSNICIKRDDRVLVSDIIVLK